MYSGGSSDSPAYRGVNASHNYNVEYYTESGPGAGGGGSFHNGRGYDEQLSPTTSPYDGRFNGRLPSYPSAGSSPHQGMSPVASPVFNHMGSPLLSPGFIQGSQGSPQVSPGAYNGRSLSTSSTGSVSSTGQSGIQAQLSPPNMLPRVSDHQLRSLEANFKDNRNPSDLDITIISAEVGLPESEVKRWFEHRLARWRIQQGLPANSMSVMD